MSVTINGSGTIGGLSVGGLPDGTVDGDTLASSIDLTGKTLTDPQISGGIYLGGTGSANYFDDYEEGTWTPTLTGGSGDPSGSYGNQTGTYTKIGRTVYAVWQVVLSSGYSAGVGGFRVSGFPFASTIEQMSGNFALEVVNSSVATNHSVARIANSSTYVDLLYMVNNDGWGLYTWSIFNTARTIYFYGGITYQAS